MLGGAVVHLAWDAFTHEGARGVRMVPELADPILEVHDHMVSGATLLQGLSSLVGLLIVVAAIVYALRGGGHAPVVPRALTASRAARLGARILPWSRSGAVRRVLCTGRRSPLDAGMGTWAVALLRALVVATLLVSLLLQGVPALKTRSGPVQ